MKIKFHVLKWMDVKMISWISIWSWIVNVQSLIFFLQSHLIFKYINLLILCQLIVINSVKQCKTQVFLAEFFIMNFRGMKRKSMKNKKFTKQENLLCASLNFLITCSQVKINQQKYNCTNWNKIGVFNSSLSNMIW